MSYPGNPSLAADVQERISNTFQQTLGLVTQQRDQEALVGCEFILRMDAQFQPAKTLVARLKSDARPVETTDLETPSAGAASPPFGDLDDLEALDDLEDFEGLADLDDLPAGAASTTQPPQPEAVSPTAQAHQAATSGLGTMMEDLFGKRSFEQILQIAETQKQAVAADPQVQAIVEQAHSLYESEAYVTAFLKSATQARADGRLEDMEKDLAKARALDPSHPAISDFTNTPASTGSPTGDALLTFDAADTAASFDATSPDDQDLMSLQAQSLSLDTSGQAPGDDPVASLASDPRQTKPMSAVTVEEDAEVSFGGEGFADSDDSVLTFDAEPESLPGDDSAGEMAGGMGADDYAAGAQGEDFFGDDQAFDAAADENGDAGDDSEGRVGQLLAEGQEAFDRGEYQAAIDVWSRIFLIDIENTEASQRIEEARNKKAELERQAEELFHVAIEQIEGQSLEEAQATLGQVLELQPNHSVAGEYLRQLEAGQVPTIAVASSDLDSALEGVEGTDDFDLESAGDSPSLDAAVQRDRVVVVKKTDMKIVALGATVLLAVIGGIAFLLLQWDTLFPNQEPPPAMAQQRKVDPIERATKMHENGATENAILQLERIQPQDPIYEKAQALIAQWKALVEAPPEDAPAGPSDEQQQRSDLFLSAAREAHRQGRFLRARDYFDRAGKILPLESADLALRTDSEDKLLPLQAEIKLFAQSEYAQIIPRLWRKHEAAPENSVIRRLLVDSYYNLALTDLQRGNSAGAAAKVKEVLEIDPENEELVRLRLFAETYSQRQQDLLYRIFVKYLPSR